MTSKELSGHVIYLVEDEEKYLLYAMISNELDKLIVELGHDPKDPRIRRGRASIPLCNYCEDWYEHCRDPDFDEYFEKANFYLDKENDIYRLGIEKGMTQAQRAEIPLSSRYRKILKNENGNLTDDLKVKKSALKKQKQKRNEIKKFFSWHPNFNTEKLVKSEFEGFEVDVFQEEQKIPFSLSVCACVGCSGCGCEYNMIGTVKNVEGEPYAIIRCSKPNCVFLSAGYGRIGSYLLDDIENDHTKMV